jgi:multiple sugar transport system ATP-binding protein
MTAIELIDVTKEYDGGVLAVRHLSLAVGEGEFLVLVGPSGCGKSTALRMIAGLESITGGELRIDGKRVNEMAPKDRDIAMVFQSYALYPHMTVAENIGFPLRLAGIPKQERTRQVRQAADMLRLDEQLTRRPGKLSGGQRQRVAMGRAIVRQPKAFLMDEPLSNLDAKLRVQMRAEIAGLQRELAVTTVYVTHDQVEAMTMGDRVAVLKDGVLQQVDTPQRLYDEPRNIFVAGFIGSPAMNLFEGGVGRSGENWVVFLGGAEWAIPEPLLALHPPLCTQSGGRIVVGIRPEDFRVASDDDRAGALEVDVVLTESLGSEVHAHVRVDARAVASGDPDAEEEPVTGRHGNAIARLPPRSPFREGSRAYLTVAPERLHFFDATTGEAL